MNQPTDTDFVPTRIDHLQKWLDKVLMTSMTNEERDTAHTAVMTPSEYFGVDRESLSRNHIDKKCQDRIFRALFVYSNGIHEVIRENTVSEVKNVVIYKLWNVFLRVLENCDPVHTQLILDAHETEQGRHFLALVNTQRVHLQRLNTECDINREEILKLQQDIKASNEDLQETQEQEKQIYAEHKHKVDELMTSFMIERTGRITAEAENEELKNKISELMQKNQILTDRIAKVRDSLNVSMDEAYQFQEASKNYLLQIDKLKVKLTNTSMQLEDKSERLEVEMKMKVELTERVYQLSNSCAILQSEKDGINADFISVSKSARATADCLGKCLTIAPPLIKYIDAIEHWKDSITTVLNDPQNDKNHSSDTSNNSIAGRFESSKDLSNYYGVGAAYCNDKARYTDISMHYSELIGDIETKLEDLQTLLLTRNPSFESTIESYMEEAKKVPGLQQENNELKIRIAARECVNVAWREPCLVFHAQSEQYKDKYVHSDRELHHVRQHRDSLTTELQLRHAVEQSLRKDMKILKTDLDISRNECNSHVSVIQTHSLEAIEKDKKSVELESTISYMNRDMMTLREILIRKERTILELQEEVADKQETIQSFGRTNISVMLLFPIVQQELTQVLNTINEAVATCRKNGFHLNRSTDTEKEEFQRHLIRRQIDSVRGLNLIPSDLRVIVEVLETILTLTVSASAFNSIGMHLLTLTKTNTSMRSELDKYHKHIEKERKRVTDVMHYATDMETFSKGLLHGTELSGFESMLSQQSQKEQTQNTINEARELYRQEHEARMNEKETYEETIANQQAEIRALAIRCNTLSKSLYGQKTHVHCQTDVYECLQCHEHQNKLLMLQLELMEEKRRTCQDCACKDDKLQEMEEALSLERAKTAHAYSLRDKLQDRITTLEEECRENQASISEMMMRATEAADMVVSYKSGNNTPYVSQNTMTELYSPLGGNASPYSTRIGTADGPQSPTSSSRPVSVGNKPQISIFSSSSYQSRPGTSNQDPSLRANTPGIPADMSMDPASGRRVSLWSPQVSFPIVSPSQSHSYQAHSGIEDRLSRPATSASGHSSDSPIVSQLAKSVGTTSMQQDGGPFLAKANIEAPQTRAVTSGSIRLGATPSDRYPDTPATTAPETYSYLFPDDAINSVPLPKGIIATQKWQQKRERFLRDRFGGYSDNTAQDWDDSYQHHHHHPETVAPSMSIAISRHGTTNELGKHSVSFQDSQNVHHAPETTSKSSPGNKSKPDPNSSSNNNTHSHMKSPQRGTVSPVRPSPLKLNRQLIVLNDD